MYTYKDCKDFFERELKDNWQILYDDEREIFETTIKALEEIITIDSSELMFNEEMCRQCQCERSGEGCGDDVPPKRGYDDRCDECEFAKKILKYRQRIFDKNKNEHTV